MSSILAVFDSFECCSLPGSPPTRIYEPSESGQVGGRCYVENDRAEGHLAQVWWHRLFTAWVNIDINGFAASVLG